MICFLPVFWGRFPIRCIYNCFCSQVSTSWVRTSRAQGRADIGDSIWFITLKDSVSPPPIDLPSSGIPPEASEPGDGATKNCTRCRRSDPSYSMTVTNHSPHQLHPRLRGTALLISMQIYSLPFKRDSLNLSSNAKFLIVFRKAKQCRPDEAQTLACTMIASRTERPSCLGAEGIFFGKRKKKESSHSPPPAWDPLPRARCLLSLASCLSQKRGSR